MSECPCSAGPAGARRSHRVLALSHPWRELWQFETIDSTQRHASRLLAGGTDLRGVVLWAERQEAGHGRQGRTWNSEDGGLYLTAGLPREWTLDDRLLGWVPLMAAVGCIRVLRRQWDVQAQLKWPNDVLVGGRKLAGLLGEVSGARDCRTLLVGMGVNWMNPVRNSAAIGGYAATSVAEHAPGVTLDDRLSFMREWLAGLAADQQRMMTAPDTTLQAMREEAEALLWRRGQVVEMLHTEQGSVRGRLEGLGVWGTALVREGETVREVSCGWQAFDEGIVGTAG